MSAFWVRVLVVLAAVATGVVLIALLGAPRSFGPPADPAPQLAVMAVGVVGLAIGWLWIIRLARRDPEAHESFFRSQDLEPRYRVDDRDHGR
jgi:hypothetical protein